MPRRLEALADAFAKVYGALDPESDAYQLRNPLLLRAYNPRHPRDAKGHRIFGHFVAGYENALLDLRIKCGGRSRYKELGPASPLVDLVHIYGQPTGTIRYLMNFLRHALKDNTIREDVRLGWFLEETKEIKDAEQPTSAQPAA